MAVKDWVRTGVQDLRDQVAAIIAGPKQQAPSDQPRNPDPGEPLTPTMADGTDPRNWIPRTGRNLQVQPRGEGEISNAFATLRALAEFDLVRVAIEDVKGQILGMEWTITGLEKGDPGPKKMVQAATAFLEWPDRAAGLDWQAWAGAAIEEILVTDALAIFPAKDMSGALMGLELLDGATIRPLVDARGRPPLPPDAAFQQIVEGLPETEFALGEILYQPMARRVWTPYGHSKVEHVLWSINLAIRSNLWDLSWFTDGTLADAYYSLPADQGWTPEKIVQFSELYAAALAGNDALRAGSLRFLPAGTLATPKERAWSYEFCEWLSRVISWSFGVSPLPIAKQQNRSTSETMEASSMESGVKPVRDFLAGVVNRALREHGGLEEITFRWAETDTATDENATASRMLQEINIGALTLDEYREAQGRDPYPEEIGSRPFILSGQGPLWLDEEAEEEAEPEAGGMAPPEEEGDPAAQPGGQEAEESGGQAEPEEPTEEEDPETVQEKAWAAAQSRYLEQVQADLRLWRSFSLNRLEKGRDPMPRRFASRSIPPPVRRRIEAGISLDRSVDGVRLLFDSEIQRARLEKAEPKPSRLRRRAERKVERIIQGYLNRNRDRVIDWAVAELDAHKILRSDIPLDDPGDMADDMAEALRVAAQAGAMDAARTVGVDLEQTPKEALAFADQRAGELVGMKKIGDTWVPNPDAKWRIDDTLRDRVRRTVATAVDEGWSTNRLASDLGDAFGAGRAQMIARTETGFSYGNGAAEIYQDQGVEYLEIVDGDGCLPNGHQDGASAPDGNPGTLDLTTEANGQVWSVGTYMTLILAHPNCVRAAVPYMGE